jgi:hypothetical protein
MYGPLRSEFFKYRKRKRKSLDGSVPGAAYNHFHRPTTRLLGSGYRGGAYHHKLYLGDVPSEYHPNIDAPAVQARDYEAMEEWDFPMTSTTPDMQRSPFPDPPEMPLHLFPTVDDDLPLEEQFLMNIGASPRPQEEPVPIELEEIRHLFDGVRDTIHGDEVPEANTVPRIADITEALGTLEKVLPEDHPDIINLRNALRIMDGQGFDTSAADETQIAYDTLEHDPVAEAQRIFDQQMQEFDKAFELPEFMQMDNQFIGGFDEQQAVLEQMLEQAQLGMPFMEQDGLEQIMERVDPYGGPEQPFMEPEMMSNDVPSVMDMSAALPNADGFDLDMIHDEINQAIDDIAGQPQEPEPDPWQMMQDPYGIGLPQSYPDPFAMPDPFGPPIGPMGPMPGPGM